MMKLFILYINDISNVSNILKFILFADDTNMLYSNSDIGVLVQLTNIELEKFAVNKLSLNISKTNYMFFGNRILKMHLSVHIGKEEISKIELKFFLGVLIDSKLMWKKHISMITSKLSKNCAIMYRASFVIIKCGMHIVSHSLFVSYIVYCTEVWSNTYATNLNCYKKGAFNL